MTLGTGERASFNPTLVRLRRISEDVPYFAYFGFNPTLVRLRPPRPQPKPGPADRFQSHAGSIEARTGEFLLWLTVFRFNPTLVRLRR